MSVQRVERALQQTDLEPIAAVGEPFDPEQMEAVEVVVEPGREFTEVIEEVRRGYLWRGKVFRYAQVRVARPEPNG
jgi:molecular chaperone GrpE